MIDYQPSCSDPRDEALLPVAEARERMAAAVGRLNATETIPLDRARARVLASDVVSPIDVPPADNSAMDGYAISAASIPQEGEVELAIVGTARAGSDNGVRVAEGEALRIFTGAEMPEGADTVVIQEHVERVADARVRIDSRVVPGKNVRHAGEDIATGECILEAGRVLEAADVGVLASLGIREVAVCRRLRVAVFTTGDELVALDAHPSGEPLPRGRIFDSNRHTLRALLDDPSIELIDLGVVADTEAATRDVIQRATQAADLIVSSGGVSTGDADFVGRVFADIGEVGFWRIAMRPGRPLAFGRAGNAVFFGLPGNPVAVAVTFLQFVKPAIRALQGAVSEPPLTLSAKSESKLRKTPGRVEYQRGIMRVDDQGIIQVRSTGKQGAGKLSSMSLANCLIVIDAAVESVSPGDTVGVQPFRGLL